MMKFSYQCDEDAPKIEMSISPHSSLEEVFEAFEDFLRGAGYVLEGNVTLIDDSNNDDAKGVYNEEV